MFLGLIDAPISYAAWNALRTGATAFAPVAVAAEEAAVASLLATPALMVGAFLGGYAIGDAIMKALGRSEQMPQLRPTFGGGVPGGQSYVTLEYKLVGAPAKEVGTFLLNNPIIGIREGDPVGVQVRIGVATGTGIFFVLQAPPDLIEEYPNITDVRDATTGTQQRISPTFPQVAPIRTPFIVPTTIPVPGVDEPIPITPTVVPFPGNDPDTPEEEKVPGGVMVKIPETGNQITFTPTGVAVERYKAPATQLQPAPEKPLQKPPVKPATDPCPCPENKNDLDEVLCRLKALEKDLLNNGYTYTTHAGASGQGGVVDINPAEIYAVAININQVAYGERTQRTTQGLPIIHYIGWFSWMYSSFPGARQEIHFLATNWIAPAGATGYMYCLHDGCSATSNYITREPKDYIDNC